MGLFSAYAMLGITTHPGAVPAPQQVGAVAEWALLPGRGRAGLRVPASSPTGTLRSRRWRPVVVLNFLATGLLMIGFILVPSAGGPPGTRRLHAHVPESVRYPGHRSGPVRGSHRQHQFPDLAVPAVPRGGSAVAGAALPGRRRGAAPPDQLGGAGRRRICPRPAGGIAGIVADHGRQPPITGAAYAASAVIGLFGFPAAITVGILKYRLYEIDVIINRAVVYGLLSAGAHRRVRRHRAGHRDARRAAGRPGADDRGGRRGRPAVPARCGSGPAGRQPAGVRRAGHALPGAVRLRRGHGRAAGLRQGRATGWCRSWPAPPGPTGRRPGSGSGPSCARRRSGRDGSAAAGRASRWPTAAAARRSRRRPGRWPSGTGTSCSARWPCRSRGTSR